MIITKKITNNLTTLSGVTFDCKRPTTTDKLFVMGVRPKIQQAIRDIYAHGYKGSATVKSIYVESNESITINILFDTFTFKLILYYEDSHGYKDPKPYVDRIINRYFFKNAEIDVHDTDEYMSFEHFMDNIDDYVSA